MARRARKKKANKKGVYCTGTHRPIVLVFLPMELLYEHCCLLPSSPCSTPQKRDEEEKTEKKSGGKRTRGECDSGGERRQPLCPDARRTTDTRHAVFLRATPPPCDSQRDTSQRTPSSSSGWTQGERLVDRTPASSAPKKKTSCRERSIGEPFPGCFLLFNRAHHQPSEKRHFVRERRGSER